MSSDSFPRPGATPARPSPPEGPSTRRAARVQRRKDQRLQQRVVTRAVATDVRGSDARRCLVPDCQRAGIAVIVGPVRLSFCEAHKRAFDASWEHARRSVASHRPPLPGGDRRVS